MPSALAGDQRPVTFLSPNWNLKSRGDKEDNHCSIQALEGCLILDLHVLKNTLPCNITSSNLNNRLTVKFMNIILGYLL